MKWEGGGGMLGVMNESGTRVGSLGFSFDRTSILNFYRLERSVRTKIVTTSYYRSSEEILRRKSFAKDSR